MPLRICLFICTYALTYLYIWGQIEQVRFGKNRVQFRPLLQWSNIDMHRFEFYYHDANHTLANTIAHTIMAELKHLEQRMNYTVPNHFNVILYPSYESFLQSNIGINLDWYQQKNNSRLVNNKLPLYYSSSSRGLKQQIRAGILRLIVEYMLSGSEAGEQSSKDKIGNFPDWFIKGYINYVTGGWSVEKDYQFRIRINNETYSKFRQLAIKEPYLAGHLFWYYFDRKYGSVKLEELFQAMLFSKNLNKIFQNVVNKRYKEIVADIIPYFSELYKEDERKRKDNAKGKPYTRVTIYPANTWHKAYDVSTIIANPNTKRGIYARVDFREGISKVIVSETKSRKKTILKTGIYLYNNSVTEHYPLIAWRPDGTRLGVIYFDGHYIQFFEYDILRRTKVNRLNLSTHFNGIHDFQYFNNQDKLLLSAVQQGQNDAFMFDLASQKFENITQDVYDNLDVSYVNFGNKAGIIFASNRPVASLDSSKADTEKEDDNYNIFVADYARPNGPHPINSLTAISHGDARYPSQYNNRSFSYLSNESGINNRYVGDVISYPKGLDTFYAINGKFYANIGQDSLKNLLKIHKQERPDQLTTLVHTEEKTTTFPITNYKNDIIESRFVRGLKPLLTDLKYSTNTKQLYQVEPVEPQLEHKLRLPPLALTAYRLFQLGIQDIQTKKNMNTPRKYELFNPKDKDSIEYYKDFFVSEFRFNPVFNQLNRPINNSNPSEPPTNAPIRKQILLTRVHIPKAFPLKKAQPYPRRAFLDMFKTEFYNGVLADQVLQPYQGGRGPIVLNGQGRLNQMISFNIMENLEDISLLIGYRLPFSFSNITSDFIADFMYRKFKTDIGLTYLRTSQFTGRQTKMITNYYLFRLEYPLDILRSLRLTMGPRRDWFNHKIVPFGFDIFNRNSLHFEDSIGLTNLLRLEYVYDNTIHPAPNVWKGLRYKFYAEFFTNIGNYTVADKLRLNIFDFSQNTFNLGFDARYYKEIYKNIVWATRFAGDFSFGQRPVLYYLGGTDSWSSPKFSNANTPSRDFNYAFQTLALNLRGFEQNIQNGKRNLVINTELRVPIFSSFISRPISADFIRYFTFNAFIDMGTAWNTGFPKPPSKTYSTANSIITIKSSSLPFSMGYGWGLRTKLWNFFVKVDRGYPVGVRFFTGGIWYLSLAYDF